MTKERKGNNKLFGNAGLTGILSGSFLTSGVDLDPENPDARARERVGVRAGLTGICCNIVLFAIKLFAGLLGGHISILADAFNNLTDMASSVVTLAGFKISGKPADEKHPFGHGRMEYIAGQVVSIVIIVVGASLFRSSLEKIIHPEPSVFTVIALIILIISVGVKLWMWVFNLKTGKKIGSETLIATARDSFNDVIATSAVLVSMIIEAATGVQLDGWAGLGVAVFIIISGIMSWKDTLSPLLGAMPPGEMTDEIKEMAMSEDGILGVHDMMIHDYGPGRRYVSFHAEVPEELGIMAAHDLIHKVEGKVRDRLDCDVTIHMDPVEVGDVETRRLKAMVARIIYTMDRGMRIHDFRIIQREPVKTISFDVDLPSDSKADPEELSERIRKAIKVWEPGIESEITVDRLFIKATS